MAQMTSQEVVDEFKDSLEDHIRVWGTDGKSIAVLGESINSHTTKTLEECGFKFTFVNNDVLVFCSDRNF